jgi:CMP-N-acetylneuraminic acid synthetase
MRDLGKIVLHIPAREGSKRVPRKNMRSMNGQPMISYVIDAALAADVTDDIYVNTDAEEIITYVSSTYPNIKIYQRDPELANDKASSDQFNSDIIHALQPDTLIMINPVCPLIEAGDIQKALEYYRKSDCDTLITSESTQMQTFCDGKPINISLDEQLAPSQENGRITILNWAITIWEAKSFLNRMDTKGFAVLGDKREFFDIDPLKAIKVSEEKDFLFASLLIQTQQHQKDNQ